MIDIRRLVTVVGLVLGLSLLAAGLDQGVSPAQAGSDKVDPGLRKAVAADPGRLVPVIVEMAQAKGTLAGRATDRRADDAASLLSSLGSGARAVGKLPIIGGAAGFANGNALDALGKNAKVAAVHLDATVSAKATTADATSPSQIAAPYPFTTRANKAWQDGITGKGIGVAVLDSGIAPHEDLTLPSNRIVASVNFAGDLGGMADAGGHGTNIAGIIAGNSTHASLAGRSVQFLTSSDSTQADYVGVAPGANLIDVRVLDTQGNGRISSVIAGIEWVVQNRTSYNIRVINLSFGAPISASYRGDPLSAAVEIAWKRGIVVVAAAGNEGPAAGGVETPGVDPYAITVGATDDIGTVANQDDTLGTFSSWGTPVDSTSKPDLVAPGRRIVSLRVPGSYLDQQMPDRLVSGRTGPNYFRLSGTSMSAAVVTGTVALMLERQPSLKPDQVKAILVGTTQPFGQTSGVALPNPAADGSGLVNSYAAVNSWLTASANRGLRPADSFARALYPVLYGQPLVWKDPNYAGINWANLAWDNLAWDNLAWDNLAWDNLAWDNLAWDNLAWDNLAWDNLAWDNLAWDQGSKGTASPD